MEKRFINNSGVKSNIFDEYPTEARSFKKVEKKTIEKTESSKPIAEPRKLKPVSTAKIINPSGSSSQDIEVGDKVRHDRFGVGQVTFLDGTDPQNIKAKVVFMHEGEKNLILKYAKLTKI
jgi:DNA helicase-2/ATP-dependent DNA helicase PcrA